MGQERFIVRIDGVKVFSVTKASDRDLLGEDINRWLRENKDLEVISQEVRQCSDWEFHCITIVLFYRVKR